jgi:hypothetical protein
LSSTLPQRREGRKWGYFRIDGDSPGTQEFVSRTLDLSPGHLAKTEHEAAARSWNLPHGPSCQYVVNCFAPAPAPALAISLPVA